MSLPRRLRAVLGTTAIWGAAFATAVAAILVGARIFGGLPPVDFGVFVSVLARAALRWGVIGAATGLLFAGTVMFAARQRTFNSLSARRFTLWGFAAGAFVPIVVAAAFRLAGNTGPGVDARLALVFSVVCGTIGASVAAASILLARRRAAPNDDRTVA